MKKIFYLILLLMIMPVFVYANKIGDFYKDINVSLNRELCDPNEEPEVKFQLFADGEALEGKELVLNKGNDFKGVFEDLPVFEDDGYTEIKYEVKFFEDGEYRSLKPEEITYKKEKVSKWVQINPEDIQPGHDYVLFTDNWFYEYNDRDPFILLDGDLYHQYVEVELDYKIINGKKSYYSLLTEPKEETIWHFEKLPETDELYDIYKGYWELTNYDDLHLVLSGYMGYGSNSYFYKVSDNNGLAEGKTYANRVKIEPIEDELGRFRISSQAYWSEDHLTTLYLGIGHSVEAKAQKEIDYAAHFIAFEYLENEEVEQAYNIVVSKVLCESETQEEQKEPKKEENPNTKAEKIILVASVFIITGLFAIILKKFNIFLI